MSPDFFNLKHPEMLQWLWALVPLALLFVYDLRRRGRVLQLFVSRSLLDDVSPRRSIQRPIVKCAVLLAGLAVLIFALAQPRWDPKEIELEQRGQNLLFCLDVSNSMRARDVDPSRLEAAKEAIRGLVSTLPAGNQVGLLAYAGSAELKCPLTPNYTHFLSVLDRVGFNAVDVGGSNMGDAIDQATRMVFGLDPGAAEAGADSAPGVGQTVMRGEGAEPDPDEQSPNVLMVLSDGESHEGHAKEMAAEANRLGVAIYIISFGTATGAPIPIEVDGQMTTLKFKGEEVITRVDDASLRGVIEALPSRRGYLAAGASNVDLTDVYQRVISKQGHQSKRVRYTVWQEKFQLFVGIGLVLVVVSTLISEQRPVPRTARR
ncbi:MAG: VWA domain-containing protein [Phycisphaerae bacterium]|nr:VWA domain-containing protein [Phycisphaerae bacterium]